MGLHRARRRRRARARQARALQRRAHARGRTLEVPPPRGPDRHPGALMAAAEQGAGGSARTQLGRVGIWSRELRFHADRGQAIDAAAELEELGYGALFIPDVGGDVLGAVDELLTATRTIP